MSERIVYVLKQGSSYLTRVGDIRLAGRYPTFEAALEATKRPEIIQAAELSDNFGRLITVVELLAAEPPEIGETNENTHR
jgi:hypothetical protein